MMYQAQQEQIDAQPSFGMEAGVAVLPVVEMSGAEMVLTALEDHGVNLVFGYPGGVILPVFDAMARHPEVDFVRPQHEQSAVHAASGYAKATGKVGCVVVTSGPGATNTVTGIADAMADGTPLVVLTGQVPTSLMGKESFQECDIASIVRPCTKAAYCVTKIGDLSSVLHEAFETAQSGRSGPVLVDLPKDVLDAVGDYEPYMSFPMEEGRPSAKDIAALTSMIAEAKRPVILAGGGVSHGRGRAAEALKAFADKTGIPVATTLMGLGTIPSSHPQGLGMVGLHGTYEANMALAEADLIISFGARFDDRVTGPVKSFAQKAKIAHVDIKPAAIGNTVQADLGIVADCAKTLEALNEAWRFRSTLSSKLSPWSDQIRGWRSLASVKMPSGKGKILPQEAIRCAFELTQGRDPFVVTDVGQHQMWVAQQFGFDHPNRLITSGGFGTMGYGLPAAIGVQKAFPESFVLCVTGDGSLQMKIQEMATARQQRLPIKILLINNGWLGMVRQIQDICYDGRFAATEIDSQPDFCKIAKGYGLKAFRCATPKKLPGVMQAFLDTAGPAILDCRVKGDVNCLPMIRPGAPHHDMILPTPEF